MEGYTEEDIKNILTDMFEKAIPDKTRILEIFKQIEDRYIQMDKKEFLNKFRG